VTDCEVHVRQPVPGPPLTRDSLESAKWAVCRETSHGTRHPTIERRTRGVVPGYAASRFFCEIGLLEDINLKVYPSSSPLVCTCAVEVLSPSLRHTSTPILEPSVCSSQVINLKNATTKGWAAAPPTQFSNLEVKRSAK